MKQKHEFKSIVAETLLIPLYMRAKESRRERPILNDKAAECLADSLEYDYSRFDGAKLSEVGWIPASSVSVAGKPFSTIWTYRKSSRCAVN